MKVVVVGGVAGGMSAAARIRRLNEDAEVVVLERGAHVSFANCGLPYHIAGTITDRDKLLLQTPESLRALLNLDVRVGHEVVRILRESKTVVIRDMIADREYEEAYDKLVLSPGASPLLPPLPGIDHERVFTLRNVDDMDRIKAVVDDNAKHAVVVGGGYIGVEMAESLRERGLEIDLVEMADQIMTPLDHEMAKELQNHLCRHGVTLHLGVAAAAFADEADGLRVELQNGKMIHADLVIMAAGVKPESSLARDAGLDLGERGGIKVNAHLQTSDPDIYAAGDAVEVVDEVTGQPAQIPLAGPANRQGRTVGDNICGLDSTYLTTKGTAVVKVFDMTGGATGATEARLKQLGRPYRKLYIHPAGHASYYPGTAPMHVKVIFAPDDGKLLGAQVVGYDGVDKRIDVFATALCAGMTVRDLQHLELAYAPPYGSAKDPVNMAGFVGTNMLDGLVNTWNPEDYPDKTAAGAIVDVRSLDEFDTWHIPGAINIPISSLRKSLGDLDASKPVFVYCKVGFRSYLAQRILAQKGFDVCTLSGGSLTFRNYHDTGICPSETKTPVVNYSEAAPVSHLAPTGNRQVVDLRGLQCPGPIRKLVEVMNALMPGDELQATASDPGFAADAPAWCDSHGHHLISTDQSGAEVAVVIRKGSPVDAEAPDTCSRAKNKKTMVVFSGDLDKVLASFIIANGALSMGSEVTLFFTFWGLNALRKDAPQASGKGLLHRMFGWMMPAGSNRLNLSKMHMMGMGTAMMKHIMKSKNVDSLPQLMQQALEDGVKLVACTMSMDVMGITKDELIDGVEFGGVASFLGESEDANMTLFV